MGRDHSPPVIPPTTGWKPTTCLLARLRLGTKGLRPGHPPAPEKLRARAADGGRDGRPGGNLAPCWRWPASGWGQASTASGFGSLHTVPGAGSIPKGSCALFLEAGQLCPRPAHRLPAQRRPRPAGVCCSPPGRLPPDQESPPSQAALARPAHPALELEVLRCAGAGRLRPGPLPGNCS
ncbi:MAG: hypothetical protein MZV63_07220 [Marinilabiliales bacterium]|nr:hypothetical protein [Marinilabiliales bacterium]